MSSIRLNERLRVRILLTALTLSPSMQVFAAELASKPSFEQFLRSIAVSPEVIAKSEKSSFVVAGWNRWQFDPELGWVEQSYEVVPGGSDPGKLAGGIDGSGIVVTVQANGARKAFMYADTKPRINTYGDSFTHGDQVNDGETWQEYLAGHLREPIGNFGTGGHGVYQAYRRMIREERTDHGAKYLILYVWGDDSERSLYRSWFPLGAMGSEVSFAALAKANVEMDLATGRIVEQENLFPTKESPYRLSDPQWIVDHFKDELALQLRLYSAGVIRDLDRQRIDRLAARLDFPFDWSNSATFQVQARGLLDRYAQRATVFILDKARTFARDNGKKLLVVLFDPYRAMTEMHKSGTRYDQEVVDYLVKSKVDYFDMNEVHLRDFEKYKLSYEDYVKQYFVGGSGHYTPAGNHFFAYSIKDKIIEWLDPKPGTYQQRALKESDSKDYLFNGQQHN